MDQTGHYIAAEQLLTEGVNVVNTIAELATERRLLGVNAASEDDDEYRHFTRRMDEMGKKAMGIWAQAQVHATLAHVPGPHVGTLLELMES